MNLKKISNLISNLAAKNWNEKCKKKKLKKIIKKGKKNLFEPVESPKYLD